MRRSLAVAVLAAMLLAVPAQAQSRVGYFVGAGLLSPAGNFADYATGGWIGTGGMSVLLGESRWSLEPALFYGHAAHEAADGGASNMMGAAVGFNYALDSGGVVPYLTAMSGMLQHRFDAGNAGLAKEPDTQVLLGIGGGLGFTLGGTRLFLDARYAHAENTRFMTFTARLGFGGGG